MKVSNDRDPAEIVHSHRSRKSDKSAAAARAPQADAGPSTGVGAGETAAVNISSEAKAMSAANQIARADDTDQAKIDHIKAMISTGTYKPDYGKVADKVMNEHMLQELS